MENQQQYNHRLYPDSNEHYADVRGLLKRETSVAPRLSSDVVEVTNFRGGVGFVAVGRIIHNQAEGQLTCPDDECFSPARTSHSVPTSAKRSSKSKSRSGSKSLHQHRDYKLLTNKSAGDLVDMDRTVQSTDMQCESAHTSHLRHNSEPFVNSSHMYADSDASLFQYTNSVSLVAENPNSYKIESEVRTKTKVKKSKKQTKPKEVERVEESHHKDSAAHIHKRSRRTSDIQSMPMEVENHTEEVEHESTNASHENSIKHSPSHINASPLCKQCGQRHRLTENHEFDYVEEIDDDLQCDICLQPFVDPYDTKCGHTFCCVCLKNYVRLKKMCPVDRKDLNFTPSDCWQSSLVMRKLVNKLSVHCPNAKFCQLTLPRTDLAAHLKERCPGTLLRCSKAMFGCVYKGPRNEQKEHIKHCKFQHLEGNPVDSIYPDCTKHTVELFRPEGIAEMGLSIVGGNDTPLRNIIVQTIIPYSLVAEDGRIDPGDIIIEVNGEDFHNVSHVEARAVLSRSSHLMRFSLLREKAAAISENFSDHSAEAETHNERIAVSLLKPPSEQLGIKITTCDDGTPGIYILELVAGRVAHANGQLRVGDRILEISHVDLWNGNPEIAARVIQNSGERVDIIVSRQTAAGPTIMNPWATDKTLPRNAANKQVPHSGDELSMPGNIPAPELHAVDTSYSEKVIIVKKQPQESLGIVVAGGMTGVRGDLPVFVQDVQPLGVLGKDKRLLRGDLLVQVNGVQLNGLSHGQAISVLKDAAQHCKDVSLTALELNYTGKAEDFALWEELSGVLHQRTRRDSSGGSNSWTSWTPSWRMWLAVPPQCRIPRDVVIRRSNQCGLGFSIVGGRTDASNKSLPIFVKYVVPNTPAATQGGIRCGDEIVAINGYDASTMTHCSVVQALKNTPGTISLTIMSWPGSVH